MAKYKRNYNVIHPYLILKVPYWHIYLVNSFEETMSSTFVVQKLAKAFEYLYFGSIFGVTVQGLCNLYAKI